MSFCSLPFLTRGQWSWFPWTSCSSMSCQLRYLKESEGSLKKSTRTHNKNKELKESVNVFLGFGIIFSYISGLITVSTIFIHVYTVFYLNNIWWTAKWCMEVRIQQHAFVHAYACKHIYGSSYIQNILHANETLNLNIKNVPVQSRTWGFCPFWLSTETCSIISRAFSPQVTAEQCTHPEAGRCCRDSATADTIAYNLVCNHVIWSSFER